MFARLKAVHCMVSLLTAVVFGHPGCASTAEAVCYSSLPAPEQYDPWEWPDDDSTLASAWCHRIVRSVGRDASRESLKRDCEQGELSRCTALAIFWRKGFSGPENRAKARSMMGDACGNGEARACVLYAHVQAIGEGGDQDTDGATRSLKRAHGLLVAACDQDQAEACGDLAGMLQVGAGVPADEKRARKLYERACDGGRLAACHHVAFRWEVGKGGPADGQRAWGLYSKGCSGGLPQSCRALAYMYSPGSYPGSGMDPDPEKVQELLEKACKGGDEIACGRPTRNAALESKDEAEQERLKALAKKKTATPKNYYEDRDAAAKACGSGDSSACEAAGFGFRTRHQGKPDMARAMAMFRKACELGSGGGCCTLGNILDDGEEGVDVDKQEARRQFRKSCDLGDDCGCMNLASKLRKGEGGPENRDAAMQLYREICERAQLATGSASGMGMRMRPTNFACGPLGSMIRERATSGAELVEARGLLESACSERTPNYCSELGEMYLRGEGGPADKIKALMFTRRSCSYRSPEQCAVAGRLELELAENLEKRFDALDHFQWGCKYHNQQSCEEEKKLLERLEGDCRSGDAETCKKLSYEMQHGGGVNDPPTRAKRKKAREYEYLGCLAGDLRQCADWVRGYSPPRAECDRIPNLNLKTTEKVHERLKRICESRKEPDCPELVAMVEECRAQLAERQAEVDRKASGKLGEDHPLVRVKNLLQQHCDKGDAQACFGLVPILRRGLLGAKDEARVLELVRFACEKGSRAACADIQRIEPGKARERLAKACASDNAEACEELSDMLRNGKGGPRDLEQAQTRFERSRAIRTRACEAGDAEACSRAARMYDSMMFPSLKDPAREIALEERACDLGHGPSCFGLGMRYSQGFGCEVDKDKAKKLFKRGCDLGEDMACRELRGDGLLSP